ncbi:MULTISPECIES: alpha-L-fucosidase [unclassified Paenibacillus]|uniref:alpha-L-fucosidase n=1 Tax=unclassified Paenibacillus TaxID=185978 RepID=UPI002782E6C6|nr:MULTISPECIES: alpha-L-fucosidase [unclassified Paenibacillus]MDQ0900989.1 alpha-L-fucosidase [Paenibacillus sp. V4I7]MDQ0920511.1 alpha-L-fucosidase [Paenibacillus sp. V4I5]
MSIKKLNDAELASMLKSSIRLKSQDGIEAPGLNLSDEDMKWWRDAKLGFFCHWGLYSILGRGEWAMFNEKIPVEEYAKLADQFQPQKFNAEEWASLAQEAGMRYSVMVTRHHDGFALWDSPGSYGQFNSMNTAAKHDFVKEYTDAFRKAGLRTGLYYSPMDWRFPGYFKPKELAENAALMKRQTYEQIEELTTRYGTIDILWYDGGWLAHSGSDADAAWFWEPIQLNEMVRSNQPKCVINPRSGWIGNFQCDEGPHDINGDIVPIDWEKNFTIAYHWSYEPQERVLPIEKIIKIMIDCFVRGGNVLLNVAPNPDGEIPASQKERLKQIGAFMRKNGEAIYGTRPGPLQPVDHIYGMTSKGNNLYLHVQDMLAFDNLLLPALQQKIERCQLLDGSTVPFVQHEQGISIQVPKEKWEPIDTVIQLVIETSD